MPELWDIYDINRNKTGEVVARCTADELPEGCTLRPVVAPSGKLVLGADDYHLSTHIWFVNSRGQLLIQKRSENLKHMPGVWAACSGAVVSGENTLQAAVRESREEMGIDVDQNKLIKLISYTNPDRHSHLDAYIYHYEGDETNLRLQSEEVSRAGWFSQDELSGKSFTDEQFRRYAYLDILYDYLQFDSIWRKRGYSPARTRPNAELIDIYDRNGSRTGRFMRRGEPQRYGDYGLTVHVWFVGSDGRVLLQRRAETCAYKPGYIASTGGVARLYEDPVDAASREVREELGLRLRQSSMFKLCEYLSGSYISHVFVAMQDIDENELRLQKEEVANVMFVSADMLQRYEHAENFLRPPYMPLLMSALRAIEARRVPQ